MVGNVIRTVANRIERSIVVRAVVGSTKRRNTPTGTRIDRDRRLIPG
jgi:hypothetical protein